MSNPSSSAPKKAGPSKKPVSPARNAISLVVLIAVLVIGYLEISARVGYTMAVNALEKRLNDEEHALPTLEEAEKIIGKQADDAGGDVQDPATSFTYLKKNYTWRGLIKSYTLEAFYTTKQITPALHHIKTEGAPEEPKPQAAPAPTATPEKSGMPQPGAPMKRGPRGTEKAPEPEEKPKAPADEKAKAPEPEEKPKAAADEKAKAPEPEERPKAPADEKAKTG
jgi:hypothetical protein